MNYVRYQIDGDSKWGRMVDDETVLELIGDPIGDQRLSGVDRPADSLSRLAPATPTKVVAVGLNYIDHAKEVGKEPPTEPLLFLKPPSAIVPSNRAVKLPYPEHRVDFEAELAVIIGARCKNVRASDVSDVVLGYTCANDISDRVLQRKDVQYTRGKSFDTFLPLGPVLVTDIDPSSLRILTEVNGSIRQDGNTRDMIFGVTEIVEYISHVMTLEPWDVILTGTPSGVGPLTPGDEVAVTIEGIGRLMNSVAFG